MELLDLSSLRGRAQRLSDGATLGAVYPTGAPTPGNLVALDLLEVEPGSSTPDQTTPEEHFLCVLSGAGTLTGGTNGPEAQLRSGSVIHVAPRETHTVTASGREPLRVLVVTPLVALSDRALGVTSAAPAAPSAPSAPPPTSRQERTERPQQTESPRERLSIAETPAERPERSERAERTEPTSRREEPAAVTPATPPLSRNPSPTPTPTQSAAADDEPRPDLSQVSGLRKASDLQGQPKSERKRPAPLPEPTPEPEPTPQSDADEEEEEDTKGLMELNVVFDGGSRGNPGQGYGSYMVQSPGRRPVVKRAEFGANYTNNQAEYQSLIECLRYVIDRLTATNRTPDGVGLDIKTDSEVVANQLQGTYKVKDAGLRTRHQQALDLLDQFGAWQIEWQPRDETEKQLGH